VSDMNNEGNSMFMINPNHWISEEESKLLGATVFPENTITFAKIGAAIFLERKRLLVTPSCLDNNMMGFILVSSEAHPIFFYYLFQTIELSRLVSATALPSLNGHDIAALIFGFPRLTEQSAIAAVLSDIDAEIAALEARRDKTRALKQGMMQELLTGRIRLL
jgi:type I restriction enzyme S subunit